MAFLSEKLISASGGVEKTDDDFNLVTGLYHFDGSNGAQNNTFLDSSSNGFTVTRNGDTTQGTFSPFSADDGKWSVEFPGGGTSDVSRIALSSTNEYVFGTGDFTIEAWIFPKSILAYPNANFILDFRNNNAGYNIELYMFIASQGGTNNLYGTVGSSSGTGGITLGAWNHIAISRASGTQKGFVNGVEKFSASDTANHQYSGSGVNIGNRYASTWNPFDGFISNVRIVKGTAVYTGNFTPSTSPLTNVTNTVNLGLRSNRFVDSVSSVVPYLNTTSGPIKIQPFSPFAPSSAYDAATKGGSGYFDGSGDYLDVGSSNATQLGSGNFTVDFWIKTTDTSFNIANPDSATGSSYWGLLVQSGDLRWNDSYAVSNKWVVDGAGLLDDAWHHVAIVRNSGTIAVYYDGTSQSVQSGSFSDSTDYSGSDGLRIGSGNLSAFNGYLSSFRTVNGTAVYTSAFTPPTAPSTAITNTKLLLNFTNAAIFDQTGKTNVKTVGNAQLDTSVKKFGTASVEFDGTDDYIEVPPSTAISPQRGSWTYECFIYPKIVVDAGGYGCIFDTRTNNPDSDGVVLFYVGITGQKRLECYGPAAGGYYFSTANNSITLDQWQHVALVFDLDATNYPITCYVNGTSVGSSTNNTWYTRDSGRLRIGAQHDGGLEFTGFIDEFRVTNKARYTSNFQAPTKEFPNR